MVRFLVVLLGLLVGCADASPGSSPSPVCPEVDPGPPARCRPVAGPVGVWSVEGVERLTDRGQVLAERIEASPLAVSGGGFVWRGCAYVLENGVARSGLCEREGRPLVASGSVVVDGEVLRVELAGLLGGVDYAASLTGRR